MKTHDRSSGSHQCNDNGVSSSAAVRSNGDISEYFCARSDHDAITERGVTFFGCQFAAAQCEAKARGDVRAIRPGGLRERMVGRR